jgi:ATP-citrate lyase beta-subunit
MTKIKRVGILTGGGDVPGLNVAIKAVVEYRDKLKAVNARIYVRRGGPNCEAGLAKFRDLGEKLGVPIQVFGPETHMTRIVRMVLEN